MSEAQFPLLPPDPQELKQKVHRSAFWCFLFAGLTATNMILFAIDSDFRFQFGSVMVSKMMDAGSIIGRAPVDAGLRGAGVVIFFSVIGVFAARGARWAFAVAFFAFGVDTLAAINSGGGLTIAFHAWVQYALGAGFFAAWTLREARASQPASEPPRT